MVTQLVLLDPRDLVPTPVAAPVTTVAGPPTPRRAAASTPRAAASTPRAAADPAGRVGMRPAGRPAVPAHRATRTVRVEATVRVDGDEVWWRLDDRTRELGHRGVEEARRALAAAVERVAIAA